MKLLETLQNLYLKIPENWRPRIIRWVISFLFGLIITLIWGVETLLTILIIILFISALLRTFGLTEALKLERWSVAQFFGRIRIMMIFAFLPAVWELIRNFSLSSAISLLIIALCILFIWDSFAKVIKNWGRNTLRPRRRRRRR